MEQTKVKYLDAHSAMSFVIKALYFPKAENETHKNMQKIMNYDDVMFRPLPSNVKPIDLKIIEETDDERLKKI